MNCVRNIVLDNAETLAFGFSKQCLIGESNVLFFSHSFVTVFFSAYTKCVIRGRLKL